MYINFEKIIDFIGVGNLLTIITLIISVVIAFYCYFKNFYRLVYAIQRICLNYESFKDWQNDETIFKSRILLYNNGRKTLTNDEVKKLKIIISNNILDYKILEGKELTDIKIENNELKLSLNDLDNSKYILIEITHNGQIIVDGRISESGEILHTETKSWLIINILAIIISFILLFITILSMSPQNPKSFISFIINFFLLICLNVTTRFIHSLFFIPDSIVGKYLGTTDKFNTEFKRKY